MHAAAALVSVPAPQSPPLPPSQRDFEVYRRTAVEGRTTREVAAEFEISQTRVMQTRNRVFEWIGTHLPPLAQLCPAERLRVAETLACEQLHYQYDEAIGAWRKSATAVHVTRYLGRAIEDGVSVVKDSQGDPRYLRLATQISKAIARQGLAVMPDPETAIAISTPPPTNDQGVALETPEVDGAEITNHPEGDCSNSAAQSLAPSAAPTGSENATLAQQASSHTDAKPKSISAARIENHLPPVQALVNSLENVPRKVLKRRERKQRMRQDLFGAPPTALLAQLAGRPG